MADDNAAFLVLVLVAAVAVLGLALSLASFATDQSYGRMMGGGGMMDGGGGTATSGSTPGAVEWTVLIVSAALFVLAVLLLLRARRPPVGLSIPAPPSAVAPAATVSPTGGPEPSPPVPAQPNPPSPPVGEPTLVRLLDEDERRMYLELREHGGEMLQRDLVALGIFSKAKVTRVLDKLEAKGLVVREAHGMTNRVRLVGGASK